MEKDRTTNVDHNSFRTMMWKEEETASSVRTNNSTVRGTQLSISEDCGADDQPHDMPGAFDIHGPCFRQQSSGDQSSITIGCECVNGDDACQPTPTVEVRQSQIFRAQVVPSVMGKIRQAHEPENDRRRCSCRRRRYHN